MAPVPRALRIDELLAGYRQARFTPAEVMEEVLARMEAGRARAAWITRLSREEVLGHVRALQGRSAEELPLYGVPFAIKDNIDLAGVPTTCACADYAYVAKASAPVVRRLMDAGAIPVGKTNLDQFATGLVGTRSPYGACANAFDAQYIAGGSSSGSAVAVAVGEVSFALGTDTAGSGRVPAALNNLVGVKPSRGLLSTRGVVPACRTLDCVSIFALNTPDAARVLGLTRGFDAEDAYSRAHVPSQRWLQHPARSGLRFGVPKADHLEFFGDTGYARCFEQALARLGALGGVAVELDFSGFLEAGRLLYEGPWIAERYAAIGPFLERSPGSLYPLTREIIAGGVTPRAVDAFRAQYRLHELRREVEGLWNEIDLLVTPTVGTIYRRDEIEAQPLRLNAELGRYTTFANLLDLAVVALPSGFRDDGLPFGVSFAGPAGSDDALLRWADRFQRAADLPLGAFAQPVASAAPELDTPAEGWISVAVCGAHMEGLPLNAQLTSRGAVLLRRTRTAPRYRLYALPGGPPRRPGLVRTLERGVAIEVEVWDVPADHFGSFVAGIPAPLGIGRIELEDQSAVSGFLCESYATAQALDISELGSWRRYLATSV
jgi:allophanate hydrolase